MLRTALFAAVGAAAIVSTPVIAQGHQDPTVSRTISYSDLDLSTRGDQEKFQRRLEIAAQNACHTSSNVTLREKTKQAKCLKVARASYERQFELAVATAQKPRVAAAGVAIQRR
ncbi:UrcA family protein [Erythrobacter rubeus]|uniref:UrcA family protein n=1 Tax=Erythrobacter rubeus TaxID=2760803 RepID=A0ABR8KWT7_9SPHN|nr:UrcA family protein [Erythrobacter rubeus]MBD2842611.1 UrcA family protein [Erythrobacter rubeus]